MEMELSEFVFRLILIFTPGVIAFVIVKQLTTHKKYEFYEEAGYSFILGWVSYFGYFLFLKSKDLIFSTESNSYFLGILTDKNKPLNFHEILFVSITAVFVGFIFTLAVNRSWLHWFAQKFGISDKFGDLSVFNFVMNSSSITPWVVIRDLKNDHMYQGFIAAYPDSTEENGIFLKDVTVYVNSTGVKMYETPGLFIERDSKDLIYDFPIVDSSKEIRKSKEKKDGKRPKSTSK
jgi:hypothetical protein